MEKEKNRNYAIDFIKIICTILILFHHFQMITGLRFDNSINFYGGKIYFGFLVEMFFIISGLFMFRDEKKIEEKTKYIDYIKVKAKRLLPLVCISAIVFTGLLIYYTDAMNLDWFGAKPTLIGTITTSLGVQYGNVFKEYKVNTPTWYISILLICYTIFYFLVKISRKKNVSINALSVVMILIGIGFYNYRVHFPFLTEYCVRGYYSFFFGVILGNYLYNSDKKISFKEILYSIFIIASIVLLTQYYSPFVESGYNFILTFLMYPAIIVLLSKTKIEKLFHFKLINIIAKISYDVYIWHYPFILTIYIFINKNIIKWNLKTLKAMIIYTIFSFIIGTISYFCIEVPLGKKKLKDQK